MSAVDTKTDQSVRLLFELSRDDNPRLFDDLMRFNKGPKRVNRLRFLAHEGLLAQQWTLGMTIQVPVPMAAAPKALRHVGVDPAVARQTSQAFEVSAGGAED
ncbi:MULTISPECIES: hypothetical protein [unclassified Methylibium]|uniref:hypothetical protein n=1 Tax=unclassified Methylibium TaxID=2633235 RepID=UPI0003F4661E|nr:MULTISPECIES: hypothetical protein [unclassified Methylibium]EWS55077.1 hypothetical protein X551_02110 [Methylibium sp. T29]EWS61703.1 hypothetical protein Y694_00488 [Methylibium sp. T29-B]